jgi:hypothetical protein
MPKYRIGYEVHKPVLLSHREVEAPTEKDAKLQVYRDLCDEGIVKLKSSKLVKVYCIEGVLDKPTSFQLFIEAESPEHARQRFDHDFLTWSELLAYAKESGGEVDDECDGYEERRSSVTIEVCDADQADYIRERHRLRE